MCVLHSRISTRLPEQLMVALFSNKQALMRLCLPPPHSLLQRVHSVHGLHESMALSSDLVSTEVLLKVKNCKDSRYSATTGRKANIICVTVWCSLTTSCTALIRQMIRSFVVAAMQNCWTTHFVMLHNASGLQKN